MDDAACLWYPADDFFPTVKKKVEEAKKVCAKCDVKLKCLAWAMANEQDDQRRFGIAGGLTPTERARLQKVMNEMRKKNVDVHV